MVDRVNQENQEHRQNETRNQRRWDTNFGRETGKTGQTGQTNQTQGPQGELPLNAPWAAGTSASTQTALGASFSPPSSETLALVQQLQSQGLSADQIIQELTKQPSPGLSQQEATYAVGKPQALGQSFMTQAGIAGTSMSSQANNNPYFNDPNYLNDYLVQSNAASDSASEVRQTKMSNEMKSVWTQIRMMMMSGNLAGALLLLLRFEGRQKRKEQLNRLAQLQDVSQVRSGLYNKLEANRPPDAAMLDPESPEDMQELNDLTRKYTQNNMLINEQIKNAKEASDVAMQELKQTEERYSTLANLINGLLEKMNQTNQNIARA
ncbi:MAG: hypothetical protein KDK66_08825 [Deltaproteobacteria bacterium]|nr:hypothetical protein [Deltaproteobacteria bacterium]